MYAAIRGPTEQTQDVVPLAQRRLTRRRRILNLVIAIAVMNCLFFVAMYSALDAGRYLIAIVANLLVATMFAATLLMRRIGPLPEALWFLLTTMIGMFVFAFLLGTASGSHLIILSAPGIAMVLIPYQDRIWAWGVLAVSWALFVTASRVLPTEPELIPMRPEEAEMIFFATSLITVFVVAVIVSRARSNAVMAETALDGAYRQSEALLENVMPVSIARRLKRGETVADSFADVTVLFADVVGFSTHARDHDPEVVVTALNQLFSLADRLAADHGCEKIKTIGDALMISAGLPEEQPDHAEACVRLAFDLREGAGRITLAGMPVTLRIGINSGPVVAGILGDRRFAYDLWGDTVNRAARLQERAAPGEIVLSGTTAGELPEDRWRLEELAPLELRNIGTVSAYRVLPQG